MEITHGIALLFAVIFVVLAAIFNKMFWWLIPIGYLVCLAFIAIPNSWEILFFMPTVLLGIISLIGFSFTAFRGELI